jgi:hypothetical protein
MKKITLITVIISIWLLSGCGTLDYVSKVSNVCPIHNQTMKAKKLKILPGYLGYIPEYEGIMMEQFPNYDGPRWDQVAYDTGHRWMFTYVCEQCTNAYQKYHQEHDNLQ